MSGPLVLCYHTVGASTPASVTADRLRAHVRILLRRGFRATTFSEAVRHGGSRMLAVTFDDGSSSVLQRALPVLADLGVPGTIFAVTAYADEGRPLDWPGLEGSGLDVDPVEHRSLTWDGLRRLVEAGWEVGSHTCTHPHLTQLSDEELARELEESRATCSRMLGRDCRSIAYPYGDLDERVVRVAAEAGYESGCSLSVLTSGPLAAPRVGVYQVDTPMRFRLKVSPTVLRARRGLASRTRFAR